MASQDWFEKDFYAILGVPKDADDKALKIARDQALESARALYLSRFAGGSPFAEAPEDTSLETYQNSGLAMA